MQQQPPAATEAERLPPLARAEPFGPAAQRASPSRRLAPLGPADPEGAATLAQRPSVPRAAPLGPSDPEGLATISHAHLALPSVRETMAAGAPVSPGGAECRAATAAIVQTPSPRSGPSAKNFGLQLAAAAAEQLDELVIYNAKYASIAYPMGDVPSLFGVCTDVVVRAYRRLGVDLQELIHTSRLGLGDRNIDHRRVEVVRRFLAKHGQSLTISRYPEDYLPGDIVTYYRPQSSSSNSHIAIVSDRLAPSGRLMILHNRGWGPQLEDALFVDQITGHYRYAGPEHTAVAATDTAHGRDRGHAAAIEAATSNRVPYSPAAAPMSRCDLAVAFDGASDAPGAMCRTMDAKAVRLLRAPPARHELTPSRSFPHTAVRVSDLRTVHAN